MVLEWVVRDTTVTMVIRFIRVVRYMRVIRGF
jgi:hypothetical protein